MNSASLHQVGRGRAERRAAGIAEIWQQYTKEWTTVRMTVWIPGHGTTEESWVSFWSASGH